MAIVDNLKRTTCHAALTTVVEQLERVIEKQVTNAQAWGIAAATQIATIRTEPVISRKGNNYIGQAEITFEILKITSIEGV